jgi:arginase
MKIILTPFFLDQHIVEMERMAFSETTLNRPEMTGSDLQARMSQAHVGIADSVEAALRAGKAPVAVSGDCCAAIGTLAGLQRAGVDPVLVWLDSHGDFNNWETTPSGFLGGMPLAMMCGIGEQRMMNAVGARPLAPHRVILSDGRDLDPGERMLVKQSGILHMPDPEALTTMRIPNRPIWVHFDTDVINLDEMPACKYPAKGGQSTERVRAIARQLAASGRIAAVSMTTWAFDMDPDGSAGRTCMSVFDELVRTL